MKRLILAIFPVFLSAVAFGAAVGIQVNYSTTSAATYADGTPILEGERFVLVWFDKDVDIDLASDVDQDQNALLGDDWWWVSYAESKSGKCPATQWNPGSAIAADLYPQGRVQLYLLDTRISATELSPMVENDEGDNFPSVINAIVPIEGATYSWTVLDANPHTITGTAAPQATDWTVFKAIEATPVPVITGVVYGGAAGGGTPALPKVTIGVTNTVATAMYRLVKSANVNFSPATTNAAVSGASAKTATLEFVDESATETAAFYKIVVE